MFKYKITPECIFIPDIRDNECMYNPFGGKMKKKRKKPQNKPPFILR